MFVSPVGVISAAGRIVSEVRRQDKVRNRADRLACYSPLLKLSYMLHSAVIDGLDGRRVECHARATEVHPDEPQRVESSVKIAGVPQSDATDIIQRVSMALGSLAVYKLDVRIQVMVHPAVTSLVGSCLDLPIAILVLQAAGLIEETIRVNRFLVFGELDASGKLRRLPTALALALTAEKGQHVVCPSENGPDAALACELVPGITIRPAESLLDAEQFFRRVAGLPSVDVSKFKYRPATADAPDFSLLRGNEHLKRTLLIAAAGGHSVLTQGVPGAGKSMSMRCFAGILPSMSKREMIETTRIWSIGGAAQTGEIVNCRPVRTVHSTTSRQALVGGGSGGMIHPGEITLAQNGVLFLDEVAEFSKSLLDALRQPIQDGHINISRVGVHRRLPCKFTFMCAMNLCPCGYYPDPRCTCTAKQILKYQNKLSGPIMDRIDLRCQVENITVDEQLAPAPSKLESPAMRAKVEHARHIQRERYAGTSIHCNAQIPGGEMPKWCQFSDYGDAEYRKVAANGLSNRGRDRLAKVARTIADLDGSKLITALHVTEAAGYML